MSTTKQHDYMGFTIEPVVGAFVIALYGRQHIFYLSGPVGETVSEKADDARRYRTVNACYSTIDKIIRDYKEWVKTLGGRPAVETDLINPKIPF